MFLHYWRYGRDSDKILRFARTQRYKLYEIYKGETVYGHDTRDFYDVESDPLEKDPIPLGKGGPKAEAVRVKLEHVLDNIETMAPPHYPIPAAPRDGPPADGAHLLSR